MYVSKGVWSGVSRDAVMCRMFEMHAMSVMVFLIVRAARVMVLDMIPMVLRRGGTMKMDSLFNVKVTWGEPKINATKYYLHS